MDLVAKLWAAGVKAQMLPKFAASMTEHYDHAATRGTRWLVTIDEAKLSSSKTVKVKNLERKLEEDVAVDEVPQYLLAKMDVHSQLYPGR